jgi:hypothetical protein
VAKILRLGLILLILPSAVSAQTPRRRDLTLDIVPLGLGHKPHQPSRLTYKLFPGVDAAEWRSAGRIPFIPVIRIGIDEGPVLETILWSGTGALVGTLFGPGGTVVGAAIGSACGYVIGCLYAPKDPKRL